MVPHGNHFGPKSQRHHVHENDRPAQRRETAVPLVWNSILVVSCPEKTRRNVNSLPRIRNRSQLLAPRVYGTTSS